MRTGRSARTFTALMALAACSLAACGTETTRDAGPANGQDVAALVPLSNEVAQPVAVEAQPGCESLVAVTASGPDVSGITIGMTADEAYRRIQCTNPSLGANYGSYAQGGFRYESHPSGQRGRDFIRTDGRGGTAPDEFYLSLAGPAGGERVVGIARALRFGEGGEPTVANLLTEIRSKYALEPRQGTRPRPGDSWGASRGGTGYLCLPPAMEMQASMTPIRSTGLECPSYVGAKIYPRRDNPELVEEVRVVINDPRLAARLVEEVNASAMEAAQRQRREEVKAASNRGAPQL